jgi:hypothetical protein
MMTIAICEHPLWSNSSRKYQVQSEFSILFPELLICVKFVFIVFLVAPVLKVETIIAFLLKW